jgi:hypothetical protein
MDKAGASIWMCRLEVVDKVVFTTLSSFSLTSLHNGCAIVRPFARAK